MADYDEDAGKLTIKLVYYGPAQSGKTTNLMRLHDRLAPELMGEIMTLETQGDRTLFFDMLPLGFRAPSGLLVKLRLYTVPGQVAHDATRKAVLSRADGVVFVADSQRSLAANNAEAFQNLIENLGRVGQDFSAFPLVVQYNKQDLPDALSQDEIRQRWQQAGWPLHFAAAVAGDGVEATFLALLAAVYPRLDAAIDLQRVHGVDLAGFIAGMVGAPAAGPQTRTEVGNV